jgi:5-methyltetrahydropteroyltriglutamate--homocysteine methyltransferase
MTLMEEDRRRIVTTHVGSLPRSNDLSKLLFARMTQQPYDAELLFRENRKAVREIVSKQIELGIDIVSDGEQSKTSFQYYVTDRLSGIEEITPKQG